MPVNKEVKAIVISVLFLLLGFLAMWFTKVYLNIEGDVSLVSLILIPIILYLILSGRLSEIKFWGIEAKLNNVYKQSVEFAPEVLDLEFTSMEEIAAVDKRRPMEQPLEQLDQLKPIILYLITGVGYYARQAVLNYVQRLSKNQNFRFVILLDEIKKFVGYVLPQVMIQILQNEDQGDKFVSYLNKGDIRELRRFPEVISDTITAKTTNVEALSEMQRQNLAILPVVDEDRILRGLAERERIISKVLTSLAG